MNFYVQVIFEQVANFGCGYALLDILKDENKEVPILNNQKTTLEKNKKLKKYSSAANLEPKTST